MEIIKKNKAAASFLIAGVLLFLAYITLYITSDYEVSPGTRLTGYLAFLSCGLGLYLFLIRGKRVILANILFTLNLIFIVELFCFFMLGRPASYKKDFSLPLLPQDHIAMNLGDVFYSDSVYSSVLVKGNDTVFNVKYSIDHFNKRITPGHDSAKNKHALFFGCSIAFGEGLEDNQTMAYYYQQEAGDVNAYNFAKGGYGTNHMLARLQYQDLNEQVKEKEGAAFYIFFWDHIYRTIGTMDRYTSWMHLAPYYTMEGDSLVRKGMFKDGRYFTSKTYEMLYQTNIVKYFKIDFPLRLKKDHYDLVCEIIKKSREEYRKQFGNNRFYCVLYPNYIKYTAEELKEFKEAMTKHGIDYIDMLDHIKYGGEHTLGGDPHPNAKTNEMLAKELRKRVLQNQLN